MVQGPLLGELAQEPGQHLGLGAHEQDVRPTGGGRVVELDREPQALGHGGGAFGSSRRGQEVLRARLPGAQEALGQGLPHGPDSEDGGSNVHAMLLLRFLGGSRARGVRSRGRRATLVHVEPTATDRSRPSGDSPPPLGEPPPPRERWAAAGAGRAYAEDRFRGARRRERDPRLVRALLAPYLREGVRLLDVPCGAGRLRPGLEGVGSYTGLDVSPEMLQAAANRGGRLLRGTVEALPFRDDAFDVVVSCRLLHHFPDDGDVVAALAELGRVAERAVLFSFWDAGSLPAWRRRLTGSPPRSRVSRTRGHLGRLLAEAGLAPVAWRASLRFVSRQTFVAAEPRR